MGVQVISFNCVLKNSMGQIISSTRNYGVLSEDPEQKEMLKGLAEGLKDLKKGERRRIFLRAEEAYGFYDPKKVIERSSDEYPEFQGLKVGEPIQFKTKSGQTLPLRVTEVHQDRVVLDGNHPLAGQDLVFEIEGLDARPATADEISDSKDSHADERQGYH